MKSQVKLIKRGLMPKMLKAKSHINSMA
jgi:hypothetical protein